MRLTSQIESVLRFGLMTAAIIYAFFAGLRTVVDFDLGWQMAAGSFVIHHHSIPRVDLFSYTAHGVEWIYPVLSEIAFYLMFNLGGYEAISIACALACIVCVFLLIYNRGFWTACLVVLAVPVVAASVMPRASLFTIILFAAFARVLIDYFESKHKALWLLPMLMVLWVNLHTGFIAGLALIGAYLLIEILEFPFNAKRDASILRMKQAWPWFVLTGLATLLNPWGYRIFIALSRQQAATRWQSVFVQEWQPVRWAIALHELGWRNPDSARWWLLVIGITISLGCLVRLAIGPALVILAGCAAFLVHQRMDGPCVLLVCLIGGSALDRGLSRIHVEKNFRIAITSLVLLLAVVRCRDTATNRVYLESGDITLFGTGESWWLPEDATNFLIRNHLSSNVFSTFDLSSYLVWKLGESYPDFADGRYVPFGEKLFDEQRRLTVLPLDDPEWSTAADRYGIRTAIFPISRIYGLGPMPLLADCESRNWTPVYMDTKAIVFVRNGSGPSNARRPIAVDCRTMNLLPSAEKPLHGRREEAERYEELANASAIYAVLGRYGEAQDATDFAESLHSGDPTLAYVEAQTAVGMRRDDEAEVILKDALSKRQTDAGWYDLGMLYVHQRRYPEAISAMENSASFSYADYERYALIANIDLLEHFPQKALISFSQAERRSPYGKNSAFEAGIAEGQAAAYMQLQQPAKAVGLERLALLQSPGNQQRKNALARYCKAAGMNCAEISR